MSWSPEQTKYFENTLFEIDQAVEEWGLDTTLEIFKELYLYVLYYGKISE